MTRAKLADRSLFPDLEPRAYDNHAAISPVSTPVREAAEAVMADYARHGVGAHLPWLERRNELRAALAQLIHADETSIALVANTTRGITDLALCMPWQRGDRVVLTRGEFPANVTPWQRAAELFDLEIVWLSAPHAADVDDAWMSELRATLERGARLVALSAVQFQTGLRMPLEAIGALCEAHEAELAVDAIQACGIVPIDVVRDHIHYLAAGSHKWLMGLEGIAFVYVEPTRAARLRPHVAGWLSHEDALTFLFDGPGHLRYDRPLVATARMFEGGMANTIGAAALAASLALIAELGVDTIFHHVDGYGAALEPALRDLGFTSHRAPDVALRSGVLSFTPPADVDITALFHHIDPRVVSCATPDGHLRFSPHWPNTLDEIPFVAAEIARALDLTRRA